jgi:uncharacterized damage-inducible protein DinB
MMTTAAVAVAAATSFAQAPAPAQPRPPMPYVSFLQSQYANIKRAVIGAAEKMPAEHFAFKPTPEVRSFAQLIGHIVEVNYQFCSAVKGGANPNAGRKLEELTDKAALVQAAKDGFAYCDDAFAKLTDPGVTEMITVGQAPNTRQIARGNQLTFALTHSNEHYGNLVTYMRLKGVVPPTSEQ